MVRSRSDAFANVIFVPWAYHPRMLPAQFYRGSENFFTLL